MDHHDDVHATKCCRHRPSRLGIGGLVHRPIGKGATAMHNLNIRILSLAGAVALALSVGFFATTVAAKSGGNHGGGGSGGSTSALPACDIFRDGGGDIVTSDAPGGGEFAGDDYCHKEDGNINVGERHRLDTNKLNPNERLAAIAADAAHCAGDPAEFTPVIGTLDITLQLRGEQQCNPDFGSDCDCSTGSNCTAEDFDAGSTASNLREMAAGDWAWRALTLQFTPAGRELVTLAFNTNDDDANFACATGGMPTLVTCLAEASDGLCASWSIEGMRACFLEAPQRSAASTHRADCDAPFALEVNLRP